MCVDLTSLINFTHPLFNILSLKLRTVSYVIKVVLAENQRIPKAYTVLSFENYKPKHVLLVQGKDFIPHFKLKRSHSVEFILVYETAGEKFELNIAQRFFLLFRGLFVIEAKYIFED
jgi:hypothetical protein